jgi:fluoride exporter
MVMAAAGVAVLGAVGACTRYVVDRGLTRRHPRPLIPWGTFAVNASGAFLLGLITGLAVHHHLDSTAKTWLGTGFCGAFTTFSTFAYESHRLAEDRRWRAAAVNVAGGLVVGVALAAAGLALASALAT